MLANGLDPNDDVSVWVDRALLMEEDVMLVGHLPHLGNLASCLVHRDESKEVVQFSPATLLCLERDRDGTWSETMMLKPEEL